MNSQKKRHSKFWVITHVAAWAMLIVTLLAAILAIAPVFQ